MTPTLILTNARILTMDAARPRAGAIALAGERILALGAPAAGSKGRMGFRAPSGPMRPAIPTSRF